MKTKSYKLNKKTIFSLAFIFIISCFSATAQEAPASKTSPDKPKTKKKTEEWTQNTPIKAYLSVGGIRKQVEITARTSKRILFKDMNSGKEESVGLSEINSVDFQTSIEDFRVNEAAVKRKWEEAANLILVAFTPALPYMDLYENNAAEYILQAGNYVMTAAKEDLFEAPPDKPSESAIKKFSTAYKIFRHAEKAEWFSGAKTAQLKAVLCLIYLGKLDSASEKFEDIGEPEFGDISYGLYWMTYSTILYEKKNVKEALNTAVKSLVFDSKDIDSFPDALLISGKCYEDMMDYYRARDVYYEIAKLFRGTEWGDSAFKKLKFIMDKGYTSKPEALDIEKVFFDSEEDVNAKVTAFIAQKEEEDKKAKAKAEEAEEEEEEEEEESPQEPEKKDDAEGNKTN